jgi:hypothetical protein
MFDDKRQFLVEHVERIIYDHYGVMPTCRSARVGSLGPEAVASREQETRIALCQ